MVHSPRRHWRFLRIESRTGRYLCSPEYFEHCGYLKNTSCMNDWMDLPLTGNSWWFVNIWVCYLLTAGPPPVRLGKASLIWTCLRIHYYLLLATKAPSQEFWIPKILYTINQNVPEYRVLFLTTLSIANNWQFVYIFIYFITISFSRRKRMEAVFEPVNSRIPNRPLTLRSLENQDEIWWNHSTCPAVRYKIAIYYILSPVFLVQLSWEGRKMVCFLLDR